MRRNFRPRNDDSMFKNIMFWTGAILLLAVISFGITYAIYSNKVRSQERVSQLNTRKIGELVPNTENEETKSASVSMGKTIEETKQIINEEKNVTNEIEEEQEIEIENKKENIEKDNDNEDWKKFIDKKIEPKDTDTKVQQTPKKELSFKMPVEGEIIKEYAKDNLVYSDTLKEWVTHMGIDIKADKTTVVKASETGTVKSIKNDPRYGITVTIEHDNGFKTIYANLYTAEFVSEGEEIKQGQTIGTVGTTASFEVADSPHLHFEIWRDDETVDPNLYLK